MRRRSNFQVMLGRVFAFLPLIVLAVVQVASTDFVQPMFSEPPSILGIPLGVVVGAVAFVWMLIGAAMLWNAQSTWRVMLALIVFTFPATFVVIYGPAVILIMQNLG